MADLCWDDVAHFIDGAGTAHLATSGIDGSPHVSVVWAVVKGTELAMTMRSVSGKAGRLRTNSRVAMMWQGNSAETYVWGEATLVTDPAEKTHAWTSGLFPFDLSMFYAGPESDEWTLVRIVPNRAVVMVSGPAGMQRRTWVAE